MTRTPLNNLLQRVLCLSVWLLLAASIGSNPSRTAVIAFSPSLIVYNRKLLGRVYQQESAICNLRLHTTLSQQPYLTNNSQFGRLFSSSNQPSTNNNDDERLTAEEEAELESRRQKLRKRVQKLAQKMMSHAAAPKAIATVLKDATMGAVDMAVDEVLSRRPGAAIIRGHPTTTVTSANSDKKTSTQDVILSEITIDLVNDAFEPMEESLKEMEVSLEHARTALTSAKTQASHAIEAIQAAAIAQAEGAASVVEAAEEEAERKVINEIYESASDVDDVATLKFEDVDYEASEMAPPFLDEAQCLIPGAPAVRVEKAPENSRRIFAGIDIMASVDDVWNVSDPGKKKKNNLCRHAPNDAEC